MNMRRCGGSRICVGSCMETWWLIEMCKLMEMVLVYRKALAHEDVLVHGEGVDLLYVVAHGYMWAYEDLVAQGDVVA